jgi:hypothetical protein
MEYVLDFACPVITTRMAGEGIIMSRDIALILDSWDYDSKGPNVRRILGLDGTEKIQTRLDLGVLQMEPQGRPDGRHPHGHDSLLDYYHERMRDYDPLLSYSEELALDSEECNELKQEALQYYHRYQSVFLLGDYRQVLRDTEHNLRLFDLVKEFARDPEDRLALEPFRPHVLMMQARARACLLLEEQEFDGALAQVEEGAQEIEAFFRSIDREELIESSREIEFLRDWGQNIQSHRPLSREERLRRELESAVAAENYERAAQLRDELRGSTA